MIDGSIRRFNLLATKNFPPPIGCGFNGKLMGIYISRYQNKSFEHKAITCFRYPPVSLVWLKPNRFTPTTLVYNEGVVYNQ